MRGRGARSRRAAWWLRYRPCLACGRPGGRRRGSQLTGRSWPRGPCVARGAAMSPAVARACGSGGRPKVPVQC